MHAHQFISSTGDESKTGLDAVGFQKVGADDQQPTTLPGRSQTSHRGFEVAGHLGRTGFQIKQPLPEFTGSSLAPQGSQRTDAVAVEPMHADSIVIAQPDPADGHRQAAGHVQLVRIAPVHRRAGVDRDAQRQILLLQIQLEEERIQSGEDVPVDEAKIIACGVGTVVGEINALTPSPGTTLAVLTTAEDLSGDDVEPFKA